MPERSLLNPSAFRRALVQAAIFPALALLVVAGLLILEIRELVAAHREIHTLDENISLAYLALKVEVDEQTGLRGYVATGRAEFLKPYNEGKERFDLVVRKLSSRVPVGDLGLVQELIQLDSEWDRYSEEVVNLQRSGGNARGLIASGRGEAIIDAIRARIRNLVTNLETRRNDKSARATATARTVTSVVLAATIVVGIVLALLVRRALLRAIRAYETALEQQMQLRSRAENEAAERRRAEEEVRQANATLEERVTERTAELRESNRELEAFAYSVSHDLRAPIRHMSGFAELLATKTTSQFDDKGERYLKMIIESGRDAGQLVDDLLAFSRMGRVELKKESVDLNAIATGVRQELATDAEGREIDWRIAPLPTVDGDRAMLRLVFLNLMANAVKYTRFVEKAVIEIGASVADGDDVIWVRDNGVGFDMRYAAKLFNVFQRLHDSTQFEGTGIGLANVRRIVARHGGRVWAEAEPGAGAIFSMSFPRVRPERRRAPREAEPTAAG